MNDRITKEAWFLKLLPIDARTDAIKELPATCLCRFGEIIEIENNASVGSNGMTGYNITSNSSYTHLVEHDFNFLKLESMFLDDTNITWAEFICFNNLTFANYSQDSMSTDDNSTSISHNSSSVSNKLNRYLVTCTSIANELLTAVLDFTAEVKIRLNLEATLTFNWIKSWNVTEYGNMGVYRATTQKQINASKIENQRSHFQHEWNKNHIELFHTYLKESNCKDDQAMIDDSRRTKFSECQWKATKKSVLNASAKNGCHFSIASASWFWFTVMTSKLSIQ